MRPESETLAALKDSEPASAPPPTAAAAIPAPLPPPAVASAKGAVTITEGDLARVSTEEFLNDSLIEFYMKCVRIHGCEHVYGVCTFINCAFACL